MKSRYIVERELADVMVDKRIKRKCNSGSNLNYIWQNEKELLKFFEFLLKDENETTELFEFFNE